MPNEGAGPIGLVGGDEFRGAARAFDLLLLSFAPRTPASVAILPTAAVAGSPYLTAAHGISHFERLGARPYPVSIHDRATANDGRLVNELQEADIVYFSGGSPTHLLESLRTSLAWTCLLDLSERGVILAGSSAGAMVLGERVLYRGQDIGGLGLVDGVVVLPHFERSSSERVQRLRSSLPSELTLLGIAGATGCVRHEGQWQVEGPGEVSVITSSTTQVYSAGACFSLP